MSQFKTTVDILASLASLIAITGVLISWYRSKQKPLTIEKVVIHKKETESTFILVVRNKKEYPVEIKSIDCYTKPKYTVRKKNKQKPEYSELLSHSDRLCIDHNVFEIGANGNTDIRIKCSAVTGPVHKLLFSISTSHGYHELWCKDILELDIVKIEVFGLEYDFEYQSKFRAKSRYYWLIFSEFFKFKN